MTAEKQARETGQASVAEATLPPIEEVRKGASRFYRRIWWRNVLEYAAAVFVVVSFGHRLAFGQGHMLELAGCAAAIISVLILVGATLRMTADGTGSVLTGLFGLAFCTAIFGGVWLLNRWGARQFQRKIDEIDALNG